MQISNKAKEFILNNYKRTDTNAISIVISYGCCGGGTIHMSYTKKSSQGFYTNINGIDVDISEHDLEELSDLLIDISNDSIALKTIKG
jgi:Fe-S cluster assembly iron-binding protein IscA